MKHLGTVLLLVCSLTLPACESLSAGDFGNVLGQGGLGNDTIVAGLKEALNVGTDRSVNLLSRPGGYANDAVRRIIVPDELDDLASTLRKIGLGGQIDTFEAKMNEAAEHAVTQAAPIFSDAIRSMSFDDARKILGGNKTAATSFFRRKTSGALTNLYRPIVKNHMDQVGAARTFNDLKATYEQVPFAPKVNLDLESYVTERALDGLFTELGKIERDIRTNPAARVSDLLQKVFAGQR